MHRARADHGRVRLQRRGHVRDRVTRRPRLPVVLPLGRVAPEPAGTVVRPVVLQRQRLRVRRVPVDLLARGLGGGERPARAEVEEARRRARDRPARERLLEPGIRIARRLLAGRRLAGAVVEQDPDLGESLERRQGALVGGLLLDRVRRERDRVGRRQPHRGLVDHRRGPTDAGLVDHRRLVRDEQLEEVVPAVEGGRVERVDVGTVREREPLELRAGHVLRQVGAVPAGLLVLELTGHEHRDLDLVDEADRVKRIRDRRDVVRVRRGSW